MMRSSKFCGWILKWVLHRSFDFLEQLRCCVPWENLPLEHERLAIKTVQLAVLWIRLRVTGRLDHPTIPTDPPVSREYLFGTDDPRRQRSNRFLPLRRPDCSLSRLSVCFTGGREYDPPVTQSIATPEPGVPGGADAQAKAWDVSPHPGADGLVQGELPPCL